MLKGQINRHKNHQVPPTIYSGVQKHSSSHVSNNSTTHAPPGKQSAVLTIMKLPLRRLLLEGLFVVRTPQEYVEGEGEGDKYIVTGPWS